MGAETLEQESKKEIFCKLSKIQRELDEIKSSLGFDDLDSESKEWEEAPSKDNSEFLEKNYL
ncbi:MAG: hypothetical protein ABEI74_01150 [Candidatus Pacearchaeota archaeon]